MSINKGYKYKILPTYDELRWMCENDPDELEIVRSDLCEQAIDAASDRMKPRLRGILFRVKGTVKTSSNSLHSCILLNRMMMESFMDMHEALTPFSEHGEMPLEVNYPMNYKEKLPISNSKSAIVLQFPDKILNK